MLKEFNSHLMRNESNKMVKFKWHLFIKWFILEQYNYIIIFRTINLEIRTLKTKERF